MPEILITQLVFNGRWGLPMRKIDEEIWRPVKTDTYKLRKRELNGYLFGIQTIQRILTKLKKEGKSEWETKMEMKTLYRGVMLFELTCKRR
jgi:hypothetical protein